MNHDQLNPVDQCVDFYVFLPAIEYLPGRFDNNALIGPPFATRAMAERSLEVVRRTFPTARIGFYTPDNPTDHEIRLHEARREAEERALREADGTA